MEEENKQKAMMREQLRKQGKGVDGRHTHTRSRGGAQSQSAAPIVMHCMG
jgi:hypothetical protein